VNVKRRLRAAFLHVAGALSYLFLAGKSVLISWILILDTPRPRRYVTSRRSRFSYVTFAAVFDEKPAADCLVRPTLYPPESLLCNASQPAVPFRGRRWLAPC